MTLLLAPTVVGLVSECSSSVEVEGQLTGSTVVIYAGTTVVAEGVATWSRQSFPLNPGAVLPGGELVSATQDDGTGPSLHSAEPRIYIQSRPTTVGGVSFVSPMYRCGGVVRVAGAVPGAVIEARVGAGPVRGSGVARGGEARFGFTPALKIGERLTVSQRACGILGVETTGPPAEALPTTLPPPVLVRPLLACSRTVTVEGVVPGATVTLQRSGSRTTAVFDAPSLYFQLDDALREGEELSVSQEFPRCTETSAPDTETVIGALAVPAPSIVGKTCAGSRSLDLTGLIPGARVQIDVNGATLGTVEAPDDAMVIQVPPLTIYAKVTARQELCGIWSGPSNQVEVHPGGGNNPPPVIVEPLFACGAAVRVKGLTPTGVWIAVGSEDAGGDILGVVRASAPELTMTVSPLLHKDDTLIAHAYGCGSLHNSFSGPVRAAPDVTPPVVISALPGGRAILVQDLVPGAWVDIHLNGGWNQSQPVGSTDEAVFAARGLRVGDVITVRQRLCDMVSRFGPAFTVQAPPVAKFTPAPLTGVTPLAVTFTNQSTGTISSCQWTFNGAVQPATPTLTSPTQTFSQPGPATASLTVSGPGGSSTSTATVTVVAPAPVGYDELLIQNCHTARRPLHIYYRGLGESDLAWVPINDSPHSADYDEAGTCPAGPNVGARFAMDDGVDYEVVCVDPQLPGCNTGRPGEPACRRSSVFVVRGKTGGGTRTVIVN